MKNLKLLIAIISLIGFSACTTNKSENEKKKTSTEEFSDLADEEGFAEKHDEPSALEVDAKGEMEKIKVEGGEDANIYHLKKEGSSNYLFVLHEWWGLNDYIINEADQWYEKLGNTNVIALDLYDGKVATSREKAKEYMQAAQESRLNSIVKAALGNLPKDAKVATIGWCFGGGWSLKTAIAGGEMTEACVMYYGMPIKEVDELKQLNSDVLFIYGKKDEWINKEVADEFKANMKEAGKEVTILAYDADHAFANPTSERYIEEAATKANQQALEYLKERLK